MEPTIVYGGDPTLKKIALWLAQIDREMDSLKHHRLHRHLTYVRKQVDELIPIRLQSMTKAQEKDIFDESTWSSE